MREATLKEKGWSVQEIEHAKKIFAKAELAKSPRAKMLEHAIFWTVIMVLACGSVAFTIQLIPVIAITSPLLWLPLGFISGSLLGLLLVHIIHDLKLERKHHHRGSAFLTIITILLVILLLLFTSAINTTSLGMSILFAMLFGSGIIIPYITHWRVFGETY